LCADDDSPRAEVLRVVGDLANVLESRREVRATLEAIAVSDRACLSELVPDWVGVVDPLRIGVIEIDSPIDDRLPGVHGFPLCKVDAEAFRRARPTACSGQLWTARCAFSSSSTGTRPSPLTQALPISSTSKSSGAIAQQRLWP